MKLRSRIIALTALLTLVGAGSALAQLSAEYRDWAKGPVQWIMTPEDTAKWKQIKNDADAKAFVDLFWARRDPSPNTPANEFRQEFDARVDYADKNFAQARKKGSMTDRGRIFLVLGPPYSISRSNPEGQGTVQTPTGDPNATSIQSYSPKQIWKYDQAKTKVKLGQPEAEIVFIDQYASNDWTLERGARTPVDDIMKRTVSSFVANPTMTQVPTYQTAQSAPVPAPVAAPAPVVADASTPGTIKTESLRTAITEFRAAKTNPYKPLGIYWTEMLTPTGESFVPFQLYVPKDSNVTPEAVTTFFGTVEDAQGTAVASFEEPAKLSVTKNDLYFDKSLKLPPGTYTATFGFAGADGKPVIMASSPMEVKALPVGTESGVTRLVLAGDIHQTDEAALVGAPYAFGRVKIVPKGDRIFTNRDEISYFVEVINPGIDEGTSLPKIQVKLELIGAPGKDGKPGRTISAPIADTTALPLTGTPGPGQYAIIAGIPLGEMKNPLPPGDYTLRVKVFDQVKKQSWTAEQQLKLVAGAAPAAAPAPSK